jgi:hypothetical protein
MSLKLLDLAVRTFCALTESEHSVTPAMLWNWQRTELALKATPKKFASLVEEVVKLTEQERAKLLRCVGAFEPLTLLGEAFVFPDAKSAMNYAQSAKQAGGTVEMLDPVTVHVHEQDYEIAEEAATALGGAKVDLHLSQEYDHLDRQLPIDMVNAGIPVETIIPAISKAITERAKLNINENIVTGDGKETAFRGRLGCFVTERTIGGINARIVEALKLKGMIPANALKVLGLAEADAAVGNVPPEASSSKGAPPDKGGVAKDQPDVRQGSSATSRSEPQKKADKPTEHVPDGEEGGPTGDVTLPDGHVVSAQDLAPSLGKLLQNIATQLEQGTEGGKPQTPKGDGENEADEADETEEAAEEAKGEEDKTGPATATTPAPSAPGAAGAPTPSPVNEKRRAMKVTNEHAALALRCGVPINEVALALETQTVSEVAPPGGEKVVKAIKKAGSADNPWAVAWAMKNKGEIESKKKGERVKDEIEKNGAAAPGVTPPAMNTMGRIDTNIAGMPKVEGKKRESEGARNDGTLLGKKKETSRASMSEAMALEAIVAEEDSHVLSIREEKAFEAATFRTVSMSDGVTAIVGKLAEGGKLKVLSFVFPETKFTQESAQAWVSKQRSERVGKRRPELSEGKESEAGKDDELASAAVAFQDADIQVRALKAAAFALATSDLVKVAAVSEALGLKKSKSKSEKLRETVMELHEEIKKVLTDFEDLHKVFEKESGGAEVPEEPAPAPAPTPAAAPAPVAVVAAPVAAPAPAPVAPEQAPAPVAEAVKRLIGRSNIMEPIREGQRYAVVAESIRVACPDLNLSARQVLEVHDTLQNADKVARTVAIYDVALSEDDRKLVASVSKGPGDKLASLVERTANRRKAKVVENDLIAVVDALRRFGDIEHRLLADDLEKPMKVARKQLQVASR